MTDIAEATAPEITKTKFGWSQYFKPTPRNARRLGDAALAVSAIGAIVVPGAKWVIIVGVVGKYLTNFFS